MITGNNTKRTRRNTLNILFTNELAYKYSHGAWAALNQRTVNGLYANNKSVLTNPQQMSYHKKGLELHIEKEQFFQYMASQESKILEIYKSGMKPSLDRIDDSKHYTMDNIQIITLRENLHKKNKTGSAIQFKSKLVKKVGNRRRYITYQVDGSYDKLNVDMFMDLPNGVIVKGINAGLIINPFDYYKSWIDYGTKFLYAEMAKIDAVKQARLEVSTEVAQRRAERKRIAQERKDYNLLYKDIKHHSLYSSVLKMIVTRKTRNPNKNQTPFDSIIFDKSTTNRTKVIKAIQMIEGQR